MLSRRARSIRPSVTLGLSARAKQLQADGHAVMNLTAGEPDFDTPPPVVEAAHRALEDRHFKYTPTAGVRPLREAVAQAYAPRLGTALTPEMVLVTNGAKQALFNAMATATDPGDRVGVLAPYWVTYVEQAHALGCEAVSIRCEKSTGFRPDLDQLHKELERGLRLLVVNSPCNPTGASFTRGDWAALLDLLTPYPTLLISDEIYEDIVFTDEGHHNPVRLRPDLSHRVCVVSGLSKAFAMTGWRLGYSIAPVQWTQGMNTLQDHVTSNVNAVAQQAAVVALHRRDLIAPMVEIFRQRRDLVLERVQRVPGLESFAPEGTFYSYLDVSALLAPRGRFADVDTLAAWLLDEHRVALIPGTAFGDDHHLRLSFAASSEVLSTAFDRLEAALTHG